MSKTTTTISFRCPPDILEQIDAIGREHFPKLDNSKTNSGCDRSKAIFAIIQAGIAALTDGEVQVIQSKTGKENSKTDINLDEVESLVKKLLAENMPIFPDEWELTQAIRKEIANSLEEGDIAAELVRNREYLVDRLNEINERLVKVEVAVAVIGDKKTTPTPTTEPPTPTTEPPTPTTEPPTTLTEDDKAEIIKALGIEKIVNGTDGYTSGSTEIFDLIQKNRELIESKLGIDVKTTGYQIQNLNNILPALGYEVQPKQPKNEEGKRTKTYFVVG